VAAAQRLTHELCARGDTELGEDVRQMVLNRASRDEEALADLVRPSTTRAMTSRSAGVTTVT
jgi:signal-transduction protein with cAMP-binding, CBS, and nucleotidyltransferase domain